MDRRKQVFALFVEANKLEEKIDFALKQRLYVGLGRTHTMENWMATLEFVGFVDGYEARAHRFKRPHGKADDGLPESPLKEQFSRMGIELIEPYRSGGAVPYDTQYRLGSTHRGVD